MTLTVTSLGFNTSTTVSASITLGSVTANVGDWIVVIVGADNNGTDGAASMDASSVSDSAGNTYTNRGGIAVYDPGVAAAGASLGCWTAEVTETTSAATITCNFSPSTRSKGIIALKVVPSTDYAVAFRSVGTPVTGAATTFAAATVSVDLGDTIFGFLSIEVASWSNSGNGDTDTVNGSWTYPIKALATTGSNSTSMDTEVQWKHPTATGNQTFNGSMGITADYCINYLILGEEPTALPEILGDSSLTDSADSVSSAGGLAIQAAISLSDETDTVSATGALAISGALTVTDASDSVTADGVVLISAAASITDATDTVTSEGGAFVNVGLLELTDEADIISAAGTLPLIAAATISDGNDNLASTGFLLIFGDSSLTDANDTLEAFGSSANFGDAELADDEDGVTAAGTSPRNGALSLTDEADIVFATNITARGRSGGFVLWG